jgi:hypothetical protein
MRKVKIHVKRDGSLREQFHHAQQLMRSLCYVQECGFVDEPRRTLRAGNDVRQGSIIIKTSEVDVNTTHAYSIVCSES